MSGDLSPVIQQCTEIRHKLGEGSFGKLFYAVDRRTEEIFAMKVEDRLCPKAQLATEFKVYQALNEAHVTGFPIVNYGIDCGNKIIIGMSILGESLDNLFSVCGRRFSNKTLAMIGIQLLDRFEALHKNHYIHRDVKPGNFLIGMHQASNMIYTIDMGLSKKFRNPVSLQHHPPKGDKHLTGTPRYASINAHNGVEQSRRDDLESLGYMLVYFCLGRLPWQGIAEGATKDARNKKIGETKQAVPLKDLCKGCPKEFGDYLKYTRSLRYDEDPNYNFLRSLFAKTLSSLGLTNDAQFDWCPRRSASRNVSQSSQTVIEHGMDGPQDGETLHHVNGMRKTIIDLKQQLSDTVQENERWMNLVTRQYGRLTR
eukprot:991601_1